MQKLYKLAQVAEMLNLSPWTIMRWNKTGRLRSLKIGRSVRVPEGEIVRLLDQGAETIANKFPAVSVSC